MSNSDKNTIDKGKWSKRWIIFVLCWSFSKLNKSHFKIWPNRFFLFSDENSIYFLKRERHSRNKKKKNQNRCFFCHLKGYARHFFSTRQSVHYVHTHASDILPVAKQIGFGMCKIGSFISSYLLFHISCILLMRFQLRTETKKKKKWKPEIKGKKKYHRDCWDFFMSFDDDERYDCCVCVTIVLVLLLLYLETYSKSPPASKHFFFLNINANWHYPSVIFLGCCRGHCCWYFFCFICPTNSSLNSFSFAKKNNKYKTQEKRSWELFGQKKNKPRRRWMTTALPVPFFSNEVRHNLCFAFALA